MARPSLANRRTKTGTLTAEYSAWQSMKSRCYNTKISNYHHYGGRGINVCDRWRTSFDAFFADVGKRPGLKYSLHRVNNDGNYEPNNVEWATAIEQNRTTQRNRSINGRLLVEISEDLATSPSTVRQRIDILGWDEEMAATTPTRSWQHRGLTFQGQTMSASAWARQCGFSVGTIYRRLRSGWSVAETLATLPGKGRLGRPKK